MNKPGGQAAGKGRSYRCRWRVRPARTFAGPWPWPWPSASPCLIAAVTKSLARRAAISSGAPFASHAVSAAEKRNPCRECSAREGAGPQVVGPSQSAIKEESSRDRMHVPLTITAAGEGRKVTRRCSHRIKTSILRPRSRSASGRFGVTTVAGEAGRRSVPPRSSSSSAAPLFESSQGRRRGEMLRSRTASATPARRRRSQHPVFAAAQPRSDTTSRSGLHKIGWQDEEAADADGVLRGHSRDRGHAVDAEDGEVFRSPESRAAESRSRRWSGRWAAGMKATCEKISTK